MTHHHLDVLVLAAHPDDAEIGCGGTIARLLAVGVTVGVIDATHGEAATRGDLATRSMEAAAASAVLGLTMRECLGLSDAAVVADDTSAARLIAIVRRTRPTLLLAPLPIDAHPDHTAVAGIARRAYFHSGLAKVHRELGAAYRPKALVSYFGNDFAPPSFCVDVSGHVEKKHAAVRCYASQFGHTDEQRAHYLRRLDPLERAAARDRYFGSLCGVAAAEPFAVEGPFALDAIALLLRGA
ncbi:MAG: bacillithiol biosynthesis deacetylase BshB1 [Planctomycetes bacterium]|nr:bacillithiol biosynthesis deacetylase BshB1 [Planctomycetota bacterium]